MEYFCVIHSKPAPFVGDESFKYVEANSPVDAAKKIDGEFRHPAGLHAIYIFLDANEYHKRRKPMLVVKKNGGVLVEERKI